MKPSPSCHTRRWVFLVPCLALALATTGCGGPTASVSGTVTYNGKPVTGGDLNFSPIANGEKEPGKPAAGVIGADGTYRLGTFSSGDGAVVGKHRVTYFPPVLNPVEGKATRRGEAVPRSGFEGLVPKEAEVEVKPGSNKIDIELVPAQRRVGRGPGGVR